MNHRYMLKTAARGDQLLRFLTTASSHARNPASAGSGIAEKFFERANMMGGLDHGVLSNLVKSKPPQWIAGGSNAAGETLPMLSKHRSDVVTGIRDYRRFRQLPGGFPAPHGMRNPNPSWKGFQNPMHDMPPATSNYYGSKGITGLMKPHAPPTPSANQWGDRFRPAAPIPSASDFKRPNLY